MLDNAGQLTTMGSSKLSFNFSPEWARTLAKAREYGVLEGAIKVAAVLCREDELCTMQTMDRYNHPDGDIMSLLQSCHLMRILSGCESVVFLDRRLGSDHRIAFPAPRRQGSCHPFHDAA